MGVVYEAEQEDMGRRVALKVLFPSMFPTSRAVERFQQEARAAGRLKHTNIVAVYQLGTERGLWYCAQELVDGPPLANVIDGMRELGPADGADEAASLDSHASALTGMPSGSGAYWMRVAEMFAEVAEGLQTAHDHGVVHRDVKPGNLLLDPEGHLRLVDFGLARLSDQANAMTRTGDLVGTPLYMSPEQFRGQAEGIDGRTDVYSLGATLYETLTLRPPFPGREPARLAARILNEEPASLRSLDRRIPRDLETIVQMTLEKEPDRRYATAQELADDLRAFAHGRSIQARRIGPIPRVWRQVKRHKVRSVLSAALLLALIASGWLALGARRAATVEQSAAYDRLVRQAHEAMVRYSVSAPLVGGVANAGTPLMPPGSARSGRSAERLFTEAIELDPTRHEAWFGRALVPAREPEARLADIEASVVRGLSSRVRSFARAHVLRALGLDSEAEAAIEAARAQPAGSPHELFFEGDLLVRQGRRDEGVVQLTRAIAGTTRTDPIHVLALLTRAQAFETEGRWAEVVVDLAAVLDAGPADPAVPVRLARAWAEVGQETEAERTLEQALVRARASFSEQDWLLMWSTCHLVGRVEWRARLSEETFDRFPNSPLVMFWRAAQVAREGRMEEAEALLDEGVGMLPTGSSLRDEALQIRAHLWFNAQRWPEAEQAHRALVERHPTDLVSRIGLAACLLNQRRIEEAAPLVEETLRIAPHEPYCHVQMAWLHSLRGEWKDGFEHARFAIELEPHSDFGHSILAGLYFDMGDFATALVEVESAIRLNPRIPGFRITQVAALNNLGRFAEALDVSEELARDEPDLKGVAHVRGYARVASGGTPRRLRPSSRRASRTGRATSPFSNSPLPGTGRGGIRKR